MWHKAIRNESMSEIEDKRETTLGNSIKRTKTVHISGSDKSTKGPAVFNVCEGTS
jgi:hypothetical protein